MIAKNKIILFLMTSTLLLNGCGKEKTNAPPATPQEAAECIMESIKELDMETLLQPRSKHSSRYESAYKLNQKMMENLTWEITDVRENKDATEIDMEITNLDMSQVMGTYTAQILENMLESPGIGITQLVHDMSELVTAKDDLISIIDELDADDISTINVTVFAYQDNGQWKVHLTHDFINAFSGNLYAENYTEDIEQRINDLEDEIESQANKWADSIEDSVDRCRTV